MFSSCLWRLTSFVTVLLVKMLASVRNRTLWTQRLNRSSMKYIQLFITILFIFVLFKLNFHTKLWTFLPRAQTPYQRSSKTHSSAQNQLWINMNTKGISRSVMETMLAQPDNRETQSSENSLPSETAGPSDRQSTWLVGNLHNGHLTKTPFKSDKAKRAKTKISSETKLLLGRYPWAINDSSRHRGEIRHVVFVKVHKAASSTVFSILVRFAISRGLNVMFPAHGHTLSSSRSELRSVIQHPPAPPFLFDILCNHVIFNHSLIRAAFPADTQYVAILRKPSALVQSAFYYYKYVFSAPYLTHVNSFEEFLQNQSELEPLSPYQSKTNNRMSIDLGLDPHYMKDPNYVPVFIHYLDKTFDLMLIAERFDESVLLLKRRFGWTMKDIVYKKLNTFKKGYGTVHKIRPEVLKHFQRLQRFDVAIYDHFLTIFDQKVAEEGPDFRDELTYYLDIQNQMMEFCNGKSESASQLVIARSRWDEEFTLKRSECRLLAVEEVKLCGWARELQLSRLHQ